ncbi:hypothetical protein PybrP1_008490 [[Pythium] brassicae (nom. inval.)]|nr:hypothetical protein PybrP1_008490 [[Pythium] brassicae (nom. inval.)]
MTDAIVWKHATESELARLAERHSLAECSSDLAAIMRLEPATNEKHALLLNLHRGFSLRQTSVLLGICQTLMERDLSTSSATDTGSSYAFFQSLLLAHSVERSPKSVQVFSPRDVTEIVDFVAHSYFRPLPLYKALCTPFAHTFLAQAAMNGVQAPPWPRPLSEAVQHSEPAGASPSSSEAVEAVNAAAENAHAEAERT